MQQGKVPNIPTEKKSITFQQAKLKCRWNTQVHYDMQSKDYKNNCSNEKVLQFSKQTITFPQNDMRNHRTNDNHACYSEHTIYFVEEAPLIEMRSKQYTEEWRNYTEE